MKFGVDYYPEHWPKERWPIDAALMRRAGIEVVRLAEFAWAKLEPKLNEFDFAWLDEAIEVLGREGIKIVLGTPTATPPIWIIEQHPDILRLIWTARGSGSADAITTASPMQPTVGTYDVLLASWQVNTAKIPM